MRLDVVIALKFLFIVLMIISLAWPHTASAVCLNGYHTVQQEFGESVSVFVGRVASEEVTPESTDFFEGTTYTVIVGEALKGSPSKIVRLFSENSSGRFPMSVGSSYLVFVYESLGRLMVNNCGNSGELSEMIAVISEIRDMSQKGIERKQ